MIGIIVGKEVVYLDLDDCFIVDEDLFAAIINGHVIDLTASHNARKEEQRLAEKRLRRRREYL